uniref:NEDD8-activating enzyme E1 regulatory subunit n=1 Tax=Cacopsylla melanoneura TaxID=428564 RepID=A0A8D8T1H8_9HEMI
MASPAPKSPELSEKSKKYDRQLRLWGDHGQAALESARVCLINATGLGTEILKSLVLPGVGSFTIIDGEKVSEQDLGTNFFLDVDSIGKSRAQVATQLLLEMNADCQGDFVDENPHTLMTNDPNFFQAFSLVVTTNLPETTLIELSKTLWNLNIPLLACRSYGFIGSIRLQISEHTVIESHPDNTNPDLRLDKPWPSLLEYIESIDLDSLEVKDHMHIPYLIILYKYLKLWQSEHNTTELPKNYKEKQSLRELIRSGIRKDENGIPLSEENFEEAIKAVNFALLPTTVPSSVANILNDNCCVNLTSKSEPFWVLAKAVKEFVDNEGNGNLPLRGSVPDMTADTHRYITLQQLYRDQASKDSDIVYRRAQQLLHQLGQPSSTITEAQVKLFCRNASFINVVRGTCIADEYDPRTCTSARQISEALENGDNLLIYHVMLRGVDKFYTEHNTYPGEYDVEPDIVKLKSCISKLSSEWGCTGLNKDDYLHEICRYGGSELHAVSAFMGGCAAQEIIKILTRQYTPMHNYCLTQACMHCNNSTLPCITI